MSDLLYKLTIRAQLIRVAACVSLQIIGVGCDKNALRPAPTQPQIVDAPTSVLPKPVSSIVAAAREQIGVTTVYDPAYVGLAYPGGDVPKERGVCTDVVIRALRKAKAMDLQQLVHEDMRSAFDQYPKNWGLKKTDKNIDHRRVPNLRRFFERRGYTVKKTGDRSVYEPGDLVTCLVGNRPHIMIVSERKTTDGTPMIIHDIGSGTKEEDRLFQFKLTGHFRIPETHASASEKDR